MRDAVLTRDLILRTIHDLQRRGGGASVTTSDLASHLGVKGPSVTARMQQLAQVGLVCYAPRQGAKLTEDGEQLAGAAIIRLGLVKRLLEDVLRLSADQAAEEAEKLDRCLSPRVTEGIARYFDSPH